MDENITIEQVEQYLLAKPETVFDYPFGEGVKVFKVKNKMFATLSMGNGTEKDVGDKMARIRLSSSKRPESSLPILRQ